MVLWKDWVPLLDVSLFVLNAASVWRCLLSRTLRTRSRVAASMQQWYAWDVQPSLSIRRSWIRPGTRSVAQSAWSCSHSKRSSVSRALSISRGKSLSTTLIFIEAFLFPDNIVPLNTLHIGNVFLPIVGQESNNVPQDASVPRTISGRAGLYVRTLFLKSHSVFLYLQLTDCNTDSIENQSWPFSRTCQTSPCA